MGMQRHRMRDLLSIVVVMVIASAEPPDPLHSDERIHVHEEGIEERDIDQLLPPGGRRREGQ